MKTTIHIGGGDDGGFPWAEMIQAAPALLGLALVTALLIWVGPKRLREWMSRTNSIGFGGLTLELRGGLEAMSKARGQSLDDTVSAKLAERLAANRDLFERSHILWVDDQPLNNRGERALLESLGAAVTVAISNTEAADQLRRRVWSAIISDIGRPGTETGLDMVAICNSVAAPPPIFYVGRTDSGEPPAGAAGLTDHPDTLFRLLLAVLIRLER